MQAAREDSHGSVIADTFSRFVIKGGKTTGNERMMQSRRERYREIDGALKAAPPQHQRPDFIGVPRDVAVSDGCVREGKFGSCRVPARVKDEGLVDGLGMHVNMDMIRVVDPVRAISRAGSKVRRRTGKQAR
jgi:hypothetical protein